MGDPFPDTFVVRYRFWWLWLRLALCLQGFPLIAVGIAISSRVAANSPPFVRGDEVWMPAAVSVMTCLATLIAVPYWWLTRRFLNAEGLHDFVPHAAKYAPTIFWNRVAVVQRRRDWSGGRWLHVVSEYGEGITLPERPVDFDEFREAVERFAGPDHPLARAVAAVAEEG